MNRKRKEPAAAQPPVKRRDHEPPAAVARWGWRYHHVGIPTNVRRPGEIHLPRLKMSVAGFATSPCGIEWMRFDPGCTLSELIRTVPHVAFEVDDLDAALAGRTLLGGVTSPSKGVRVALIIDQGAPVELLEFRGRTHRRSVRPRKPSLKRAGT